MKFKVGDKVKVYGHYTRKLGYVPQYYSMDGAIGKVRQIVNKNEIIIQYSGPSKDVGEVHPNQCRRFK